MSNSIINYKSLFLHNYQRFQRINNSADNRAIFEALYNCFENAAKYSMGEDGKYITRLKESPHNNLLRSSFIFLYTKPKQNTFIKKIKRLRSFQPIYNNKNQTKSFMTKDRPFESFLEVLYTIRNNVRHGDKEYSQRSEEIINASVAILEEYMFNVYETLFPEIIAENERRRRIENDSRYFRKSLKEKSLSILYIILWVLFFGYIGFGGYFDKKNDSRTINIDCDLNPIICKNLDERAYTDSTSGDNMDIYRPYR